MLSSDMLSGITVIAKCSESDYVRNVDGQKHQNQLKEGQIHTMLILIHSRHPIEIFLGLFIVVWVSLVVGGGSSNKRKTEKLKNEQHQIKIFTMRKAILFKQFTGKLDLMSICAFILSTFCMQSHFSSSKFYNLKDQS